MNRIPRPRWQRILFTVFWAWPEFTWHAMMQGFDGLLWFQCIDMMLEVAFLPDSEVRGVIGNLEFEFRKRYAAKVRSAYETL